MTLVSRHGFHGFAPMEKRIRVNPCNPCLSGMTLVSIGDQVTEGNCAFHSRFNRAVNFQRDGRLVSVVDEQIGAGPLNIVIRNLNAGPAAVAQKATKATKESTSSFSLFASVKPQPRSNDLAGSPLEITTDTVVFEGRRFRFTHRHRYDSRAEFPPSRLSHFRRNLRVFEELLRTASPPSSLAFLLDGKRINSNLHSQRHEFPLACPAGTLSPTGAEGRGEGEVLGKSNALWCKNLRPGFERSFAEHMRHSVRRLFRGHLLEGVRDLRGCGLGLTPSGDDFLAGLLIGLHLRQSMSGENLHAVADAVFHAAKAGNIFSNTFLDLARRGLLFERMKALIRALTHDGAAAVRKAAERLFAIGETSGTDLGTGFLMTVRAGSGVLQRWMDGIRDSLPSEAP